jgi:hypothetical protein
VACFWVTSLEKDLSAVAVRHHLFSWRWQHDTTHNIVEGLEVRGLVRGRSKIGLGVEARCSLTCAASCAQREPEVLDGSMNRADLAFALQDLHFGRGGLCTLKLDRDVARFLVGLIKRPQR